MADLHQLQGAAAFQDLLRKIGDISERTCADAFIEPHADSRDYRQMVGLLQGSIEANVAHADTAHREGYLRSLAHLLCLNADGCGTDGSNWAPIHATAASFAG